jgi:hypothetical protein
MNATAEDVTVKRLKAAKRLLAAQQARDDFYQFMRLMLPDEVDPDDSTKSEYKDTRHGRLLCDLVTKIESGAVSRIGVSIPPQHGKTWHLSIYGPAWIMGRNPRAKIIIASYNETRAEELGNDFRNAISSPQFRQIFPDCKLEHRLEKQVGHGYDERRQDFLRRRRRHRDRPRRAVFLHRRSDQGRQGSPERDSSEKTSGSGSSRWRIRVVRSGHAHGRHPHPME